MDTLRGIFPARSKFKKQKIQSELQKIFYSIIEVPPKRDFLKENIKRIREIQKSAEISKSAPLKPVHRSSGSKKLTTNRTNQNPKSIIKKCLSEASLKTIESDRRDNCSQTRYFLRKFFQINP